MKRLSLQSSHSSAESLCCIWLSVSQTFLTGHFSSWERHQLLRCLFFLILLPLHPSPPKRIIYNSVTALFHLPSISSVSVKTPPTSRVICFHLFFASCHLLLYLFVHVKVFHIRVWAAIIFCDFTQKKECLSKQCWCCATHFLCKYFSEIVSSTWPTDTEHATWWSPAAKRWQWQVQHGSFQRSGTNVHEAISLCGSA